MRYINPYEMVKLRIERNTEVINILELEKGVLKLDLVSVYRKLKYNNKCIEHMKQLNDVDKLQRVKYISGREYDIQAITNTMRDTPLDIKDLMDEMKELVKKIHEASKKVERLNNEIRDNFAEKIIC